MKKSFFKKIDGFFNSIDKTLDLIEETRINPIPYNNLEDILFGTMTALTFLTSIYGLKGELKSLEGNIVYTGAVVSLIAVFGYRIKRYYDEFKRRGKIY
ncbi:MAG: hypothetical protein QXF25_03095 [Candidatus Pacearchaeota archaeon]